MSQTPRTPDVEIRKKEVEQLKAVVKRMDEGVTQLDNLIEKLEADINNSPLTAYRLRRMQKTTQSE